MDDTAVFCVSAKRNLPRPFDRQQPSSFACGGNFVTFVLSFASSLCADRSFNDGAARGQDTDECLTRKMCQFDSKSSGRDKWATERAAPKSDDGQSGEQEPSANLHRHGLLLAADWDPGQRQDNAGPDGWQVGQIALLAARL